MTKNINKMLNELNEIVQQGGIITQCNRSDSIDDLVTFSFVVNKPEEELEVNTNINVERVPKLVKGYLECHGNDYQEQVKLKFDNNTLVFDFYLPEYGILIDYKDNTHFEPVKGNEEDFKNKQVEDTLKRVFAKLNGFTLLEPTDNLETFNQVYKYLDDNIIKSYKNSKQKIKFICSKCGNIYSQTVNKHLSGYGCPCCSLSKNS